MVKKSRTKLVVKYFPYSTLWIYLGFAFLLLLFGVYLLFTDVPRLLVSIFVVLSVLVAGFSFLLDKTTILLDRERDLLYVRWRKWYLRSKQEKKFHMGSIRAVIFRHTVRHGRGTPLSELLAGQHDWQLYVLFEDGEETDLFPDHAPVREGAEIAQEIAHFAGVPCAQQDVDAWKSPY
jgi:hypothetical protein